MIITDYFTEDEAADRVYDMEQLREYVHGLEDAIVNGLYKKTYVEAFRNR